MSSHGKENQTVYNNISEGGDMETLQQPSATVEKRLLWDNVKEKVLLKIPTKNRIDNIKVLEDVYWEEYYELSDIHYEWNDGFLEEKPVSDYKAYLMFLWFGELLRHFFTVYPIGKMIGLEMGFRLQLPHKVTIRKPDTGIILNTNPVEINESDNRYSGIVDLCIELLSDSNRKNIERDTKVKKEEYCLGGVQEYFILDGKMKQTVFYHRLKSGKYAENRPVKGILKSRILPGFQFRIADLASRPSLEEMSKDEVYKDFILPFYQAEKQKAEQERQRADSAEQRANSAEQRADALSAKLKSLGIEF